MMYYSYCITNLVNNKTYIGQRKCPKNKTPETDSYMGSGVYLKNAKEKYGLKNFEKKIIAICETRENIDILEKVFIKLLGNFFNFFIKNTLQKINSDV